MPSMTPYGVGPYRLPQPNLGKTGGHTTAQYTNFGVAAAGFDATASNAVKGTFPVPHDAIQLIEFGVLVLSDTTAMTTPPQFTLNFINPTTPASVVTPVTGSPAVGTTALVSTQAAVLAAAAGPGAPALLTAPNPALLVCFPTLQYNKQYNTLDVNYTTTLPAGQALPGAPTFPIFLAGTLIQFVQTATGVTGTQTFLPYLIYRTFPLEI